MCAECDRLRAERAKPTQSDDARNLIDTLENLRGEPMSKASKEAILSAFASIRAEGSAERTKLEAALAEALQAKPWLRNRVQALIAQPAESGATELRTVRAEFNKLVIDRERLWEKIQEDGDKDISGAKP